MKRKAFTLAEIMIVLTVIGILSVILLPVAFNSTPDKNILKFKKGYNDFAIAIRELSNSDKYFMPGDFSYLPDGSISASYGSLNANYFMESLADVLSYKSANFASAKGVNIQVYNSYVSYYPGTKLGFDVRCKNYSSFSSCDRCSYIELNNGLFVYEPYHNYWAYKADIICNPDHANYDPDECQNFPEEYSAYCIDIDGEGGVLPFGIGIRHDGKISAGKRAEWWLSRDITKKETDCCPKTLSDNSLCDTDDTVCAE